MARACLLTAYHALPCLLCVFAICSHGSAALAVVLNKDVPHDGSDINKGFRTGGILCTSVSFFPSLHARVVLTIVEKGAVPLRSALPMLTSDMCFVRFAAFRVHAVIDFWANSHLFRHLWLCLCLCLVSFVSFVSIHGSDNLSIMTSPRDGTAWHGDTRQRQTTMSHRCSVLCCSLTVVFCYLFYHDLYFCLFRITSSPVSQTQTAYQRQPQILYSVRRTCLYFHSTLLLFPLHIQTCLSRRTLNMLVLV